MASSGNRVSALRQPAKPGFAGFYERSALRTLVRFSRKKPLGALGAVVLVGLFIVALAAPLIATHDPLQLDVPSRLLSPSAEHLMGTDQMGRDLFSRVVYGARVSLYVGFLTVLFATVVGTTVGVVSGYFGGWVDMFLQRVVDAFLGFPALILAIMLMAAFGSSINNTVIAIGVSLAPRMARISRSSVLSVREEDYIRAATAIGAGHRRILVRHVLVNCLTPVMVLGTAYLGTAIIAEASLSFLGLGVPPPHSSWGRTLQSGVRYMQGAPWLMLAPGIALSLTVFAFNLLGDAIRDTIDPRLRI